MWASPPLPPLNFVAALVDGPFVDAPPVPADIPVTVGASVGVKFVALFLLLFFGVGFFVSFRTCCWWVGLLIFLSS